MWVWCLSLVFGGLCSSSLASCLPSGSLLDIIARNLDYLHGRPPPTFHYQTKQIHTKNHAKQACKAHCSFLPSFPNERNETHPQSLSLLILPHRRAYAPPPRPGGAAFPAATGCDNTNDAPAGVARLSPCFPPYCPTTPPPSESPSFSTSEGLVHHVLGCIHRRGQQPSQGLYAGDQGRDLAK